MALSAIAADDRQRAKAAILEALRVLDGPEVQEPSLRVVAGQGGGNGVAGGGSL